MYVTLNSDNIEGLFLDNNNATYDATAKKFLSHKIILAWILKHCVGEFKECAINEIADKYIEGAPEVGMVPVNPDLTNAPRKIEGSNTELKTLTEGATVFDIRFVAYAPSTNEPIKLIINIEAQKRHNPGYYLTKRAVFHACRLISSQYGVEFEEPNFNDIKKVVTIWLSFTSPHKEESAIMQYKLTEDALIGNIPDVSKNFDLLRIVMVYIGSSDDKMNNRLLKLLHLIFRAKIKASEKIGKLKSDYDIVLDNKMARELNIMCNLSEGIAEEARAEAIEKNTIDMMLSMLKEKISIDIISRVTNLSTDKIVEMGKLKGLI